MAGCSAMLTAMENSSPTSRRRLTAIHEAAHAVVAVRAGFPLVPSGPKRWLGSGGGIVVEVFAHGWNGTFGACYAGCRPLCSSNLAHLPAAERAYCRRAYAAEAAVLLAGQKAEHRLRSGFRKEV